MITRRSEEKYLLKRVLEKMGTALTIPQLWKKLQTDRALLYGLSVQSWQVLVGPITVLLILRYLTPVVQGYYYAFWSILGFQTFFEVGFPTVLFYMCSHEWAHLQFNATGEIVGDAKALARLTSLGRLVSKWYAAASALFMIGIGTAGYFFLSARSGVDVGWQIPWMAVVIAAGLLFLLTPFITVLDGCNQMAATNQFRFYEGILSTFCLWGVLFNGGGLWAILASACAKLSCTLYLFFVRFRQFFKTIWRTSGGHKVSWGKEIWPLQWKVGLQGIAAYFASTLCIPVMFYYDGPVVAGQMGMTWSIIGFIHSAALVWLSTRAPRFGMLIAKKDYRELDKLFGLACIISIVVFSIGAVAFGGVISILYATKYSIAIRFLPPFSTILLLVAYLFSMLATAESIYLLAHKRQPINVFLPPLVGNLLAGFAVWFCGSRFGAIGVGGGYLFTMIVLFVWESIVWYRCRASWHNEELA